MPVKNPQSVHNLLLWYVSTLNCWKRKCARKYSSNCAPRTPTPVLDFKKCPSKTWSTIWKRKNSSSLPQSLTPTGKTQTFSMIPKVSVSASVVNSHTETWSSAKIFTAKGNGSISAVSRKAICLKSGTAQNAKKWKTRQKIQSASHIFRLGLENLAHFEKNTWAVLLNLLFMAILLNLLKFNNFSKQIKRHSMSSVF